MSDYEPRLQFVIVDGEIHPVGDFAHLEPGSRPAAYCPECNHRVILKLGRQLAHHAAHQPRDICIMTAPETVIHFNSKMHIAQELQIAALQGRSVIVSDLCAMGHWTPGEWLPPWSWDRVEVERQLACGLRPDVSLWLGDRMVGGIEVFVSHEVEEAKGRTLEALGVEWIEVKGSTHFYQGDRAWRASQPLPTRRDRGTVRIECDRCPKPVERKPAQGRTLGADYVAPEPCRRFPGLVCVACGEPEIWMATVNGPLCQKCRSNPNIRPNPKFYQMNLEYYEKRDKAHEMG